MKKKDEERKTKAFKGANKGKQSILINKSPYSNERRKKSC